MIRFLTILTILAFSASQGFATPLDLVVTGGNLETSIPGAIADVIPASMPLSTSSSAVFSSLSSSATYEFSNSSGVASFDIQPVIQSAIWDSNMNLGGSLFAEGIVVFELNEAADYSVTGSYSGSVDGPSVLFRSFVELRNQDTDVTLVREIENSTVAANHAVNGLDDANSSFSFIGSTTGTLSPGNYFIDYELLLINGDFGTFGEGDATGFVNLTLTRVIPEPNSAVLMLLGLGAGLSCRRRLI